MLLSKTSTQNEKKYGSSNFDYKLNFLCSFWYRIKGTSLHFNNIYTRQTSHYLNYVNIKSKKRKKTQESWQPTTNTKLKSKDKKKYIPLITRY